jgi:hypothetical protein
MIVAAGDHRTRHKDQPRDRGSGDTGGGEYRECFGVLYSTVYDTMRGKTCDDWKLAYIARTTTNDETSFFTFAEE